MNIICRKLSLSAPQNLPPTFLPFSLSLSLSHLARSKATYVCVSKSSGNDIYSHMNTYI